MGFVRDISARYVQDVATVSQNVRDMQRALLDLALLTEAPGRGRGRGVRSCGFQIASELR